MQAFLDDLTHPAKPEILALRTIILGFSPDVRESIKWNAPSFSTSEHFATFHLRYREGVQIVLHLGAKPRPDADARKAIADPEGVLKWRGPDRATVSFRDLTEIEVRKTAFVRVLRQWIALM